MSQGLAPGESPEHILEALTGHTPNLISYLDSSLRYVFINRAYGEWWGRPRAELIGKNSAEVFSPEDYARIRPYMEKALAGESVQFEQTITVPGKLTRSFHASYEPDFDADGSVKGFSALVEETTEQIGTRKALNLAQSRFSGIVEMALDGIISIDENQIITLFNQGAEGIFGYSQQEILGKPLETLIPEEFRKHHPHHVQGFAQGSPTSRQMNQRGVIHGRRKDGSTFPAEASISKTESEGSASYTAIIRDITERIEQETALRKKEAYQRSLFLNAPIGMALSEQGGAIVDVNPRFCETIGRSMEEILGMKMGDFTPQQDAASEQMQLQELKASGKFGPYENNFIHKDGSLIPVRLRGQMVEMDGKSFIWSSVENLSDQVRVEWMEHSLANAQRIAKIGNWDLNVKTGEFWWSEEIYRIIGVKPEEFIPTYQSFLGIVHPKDRALVEEEVAGAMKNLRPYSIRHRVMHADGRVLTVQEIGEIVFDENGKPLRLTGTVQDISELSSLETQLRQSQKMEAVGQLAGGVAHDFNNMLQIIRGYTQIALVNIEKERLDRLPDNLKKIQGAAVSAGSLTRQLLAFSRREVFQKTAVDLNSLIDNQLKMMGRLIGANIHLQVSTHPSPVIIGGDPGMLEQVVLNLCVNARDAMPEGGRLSIDIELFTADAAYCKLNDWAQCRTYAHMTVSDTGMGMDKEICERIFEPFFTTKEASKGTGLGLSTVYGILQQHDGWINVYSEPGMGATFNVYLPLNASAQQEQPAAEAVEAQGGNEVILIAEDEQGVRELAESLLTSQGYRVLTAEDGEAAMALFDRESATVQLVLLDMVMPKASGRAVYEHVKAARPELPVLFSSGYAADSLDRDFIQQQEVHLLRKPYDPIDLFRAVRALLDEARS